MLDSSVSEIERAVSTVATSLLNLAKAKDQQAWNFLVELHAPLVYGWCRRRGLGAEESRDVGQEVFETVARNLERFSRQSEAATFRGWIRRITDNKIYDHWRRINKEPKVSEGGDGLGAVHAKQDDILEDAVGSEDKELFLRIMEFARDQINPDHWDVFWRIAVDEQSPAAVAAEFGIERHNVYMIKSRILRQLRDLFTGNDGEAVE